MYLKFKYVRKFSHRPITFERENPFEVSVPTCHQRKRKYIVTENNPRPQPNLNFASTSYGLREARLAM